MRKKVLIISTNADESGVPRHVEVIANGLKSEYELVFVFGENGQIASRIKTLGLKVYICKWLRSDLSLLKTTISAIQLSKIIFNESPEVVHLHSAKAGLVGRIVSTLFRCRIIYTVHGWGWRGKRGLTASMLRAIEFILSFQQNVNYVFVANAVAVEMLESLKRLPKRYCVVANGVPDLYNQEDDTPPQRPYLIMPARVCDAKDHKMLVIAYEASHFDGDLVLCGAGTEQPEFAQDVQRWAPIRSKDIRMLGERNDVLKLIGRATAFALISKYEALPISIIEAMCHQKMIIATNVGGVSELVEDGKSGILVEPGDVSSLSKAINLVSDRTARNTLAGNARIRYVKHFRSNKMLEEIKTIYKFPLNENRYSLRSTKPKA